MAAASRVPADVGLPVAADSERPFAACYSRVYEPFKRYAWAELRDADSAEEVVQSTLAAIWQRHFIGAGSRYVEVDPLAFRMLKLRVGNQNRYRPSHVKPPSRLSSWIARAKRLALPRALRKPDGLESIVDAALDAMRPRCREVFLLRREAAMSFKEIALLCGTGPRSVAALMHRAQSVLRDHVDRAGFGPAVRRSAVDSGRWKIAEFSREPDLYESQEAIIERDANPDFALLSDYIAGELPPESMADVAARLERDPEFHAIAEPLLMAWSVPSRSQPVARHDLLRSWLQVRRRAELPEIPGHPALDAERPAQLHEEIEALLTSVAVAVRANPASAADFYTDDASITGDGRRYAGREQIAQYWSQAATAAGWTFEVLEAGGDGPAPWVRGRWTVRERGGDAMATEFVGLLRRCDDGALRFHVHMFAAAPAD